MCGVEIPDRPAPNSDVSLCVLPVEQFPVDTHHREILVRLQIEYRSDPGPGIQAFDINVVVWTGADEYRSLNRIEIYHAFTI